MKQRFGFMLAISVLASAYLAGCGKKSADETQKTADASQTETDSEGGETTGTDSNNGNVNLRFWCDAMS